MNRLTQLKHNFHKLNQFKCALSTFSGAKRGDFTQTEPKLGNQYEEDTFLKESLKLDIPQEVNNLIHDPEF